MPSANSPRRCSRRRPRTDRRRRRSIKSRSLLRKGEIRHGRHRRSEIPSPRLIIDPRERAFAVAKPLMRQGRDEPPSLRLGQCQPRRNGSGAWHRQSLAPEPGRRAAFRRPSQESSSSANGCSCSCFQDLALDAPRQAWRCATEAVLVEPFQYAIHSRRITRPRMWNSSMSSASASSFMF